MQLQQPSSLRSKDMRRFVHSSWPCTPVRHVAQRPWQRAHVAAIGKDERAWGSGWGRRKGQSMVKKPVKDTAKQQQPKQEQQQPKVPQQKALTKADYAAAYDAIADTIHQKFVQSSIFACCQPASLLFYEAVKQANPSADPQFVLGYTVITEPSPGSPDVCGRHMWVQLDGRQYDIGQMVAATILQKTYGRSVPLPKYGLERPPNATYLGWDIGALAKQVVPHVTTAKQDAGLVAQFESESGRELYWSGSPPQLLAVRREILSTNWL